MIGPKKTRRTEPRPASRGGGHDLSGRLREVIASRGLTGYALAGAAGLDHRVVARFLSGERDIKLETADRLAATLRLRLVEVAQPSRRPKPRNAAGPEADESRPDG